MWYAIPMPTSPDKAVTAAKILFDIARMGQGVVLLNDLERWSGSDLKRLLDYVIDNQATHKLRLIGIRTDTSVTDKFGLLPDHLESMEYRGIPVAKAAWVRFDSMEFAFQPAD